ncbi:anti-sigma factor [Granulicella arctica]|uniref:anti-sigma factor n=1 Tax=Granulicella arctica TaxID=940613 RepID=UPI0021E0172A|nr:anti-sigma factor [Granulicella arctica]
MTDTQHINPEDLTLHAMRLLSAEEAAAVQAHLAECSECRAEFAVALDDLSIVAMSVELATPSPAARERFTQQVTREKRTVTAPVTAVSANEQKVVPMIAPKQGTSGKLLPWLGWAVAAGVTLSAASLYRERVQLQTTISDQSAQLQSQTAQMATLSADASKARAIMDALTDSSAMRVTLNTTPAAKALPQGRATYLADKGTLIFTANNLAPLPSAKTYELWLIPANGTAPIAAGTFHPDGRGYASVVMPQLPVGVQAKAFGVTVEAEGGATSPTLPIILVGA